MSQRQSGRVADIRGMPQNPLHTPTPKLPNTIQTPRTPAGHETQCSNGQPHQRPRRRPKVGQNSDDEAHSVVPSSDGMNDCDVAELVRVRRNPQPTEVSRLRLQPNLELLSFVLTRRFQIAL